MRRSGSMRDVPVEIEHLQFAKEQKDSDSSVSDEDVQSHNSRRGFREEVNERGNNNNGQVIGLQMQ